MITEMEKPALAARAAPVVDPLGGKVGLENIPSRPFTQTAWQIASVVFGSESPAPRRDIRGAASDGIRYWRQTQ
jgi:hypothetical protein